MGSKCHPPLISVSMEIASAPMTVDTLGVAKVSPMEPPTGVQQTTLAHDSSHSLSDTVIDQHDSKDTLKEEDTAVVSTEGLVNPSTIVTGDKLVDDDNPLSFDALLDPSAIQDSSDSETETTKTELDYLEQQACISLQTDHDSGHAYRSITVVDALTEVFGDALHTTHDTGCVEEKVELLLGGAEAEGGALVRVPDDPTKGEYGICLHKLAL